GILEILHKYYPWQTWKDVSNAELSYCSSVTKQKIDDIEIELAKLKELSAIFGARYASCREVCEANWARAALPFYELLEQVPSITDIPSYKYLTTDSEKFEIEKALKCRMQKDNIQSEVSEQSLLEHLEMNFEDDSIDRSSTWKKTGMRSGKRFRRMSSWRFPVTGPRTSFWQVPSNRTMNIIWG
ncbi:hypothetical protein C5167_005673, partial [Papaver somniferum]